MAICFRFSVVLLKILITRLGSFFAHFDIITKPHGLNTYTTLSRISSAQKKQCLFHERCKHSM